MFFSFCVLCFSCVVFSSTSSPKETPGSILSTLLARPKYELEDVRKLLSRGLSAKVLDSTGANGYHYIAKNGRVDVFSLIKEMNGERFDSKELEISSKNGEFPICIAANFGQLELLKAFKEVKINFTGFGVLSAASQHNPKVDSKTRKSVIEFLVTEAKVPVDEENSNGNTALMIAVEIGDIDLVNFLLLNNSDPFHNSSNGYAPLSLAVTENQDEILKILLEKGKYIPGGAHVSLLTAFAVATRLGRTAAVDLIKAKIPFKVELAAEE